MNPTTKQTPVTESHPRSALCKGNFFTNEDARGISIFILSSVCIILITTVGYIVNLYTSELPFIYLSISASTIRTNEAG